MKKVLVISYYWPPSGGPGVQRVLKFCKYLPEFGWEPIVLTVKNGEFPYRDESLLVDAESIKVYYAKAIAPYGLFKVFSRSERIPTHLLSPQENERIINRIARWVRYNMVVPDGRIGWYPGAVKLGLHILERENIDLIFSSGPPHTAHLIARKLSENSGLKWTADFRDPWTDRFYYVESPRCRLTKWLDGTLEKKILIKADRITVVSPGFCDQLNNHVPIKDKSDILFNGFDEEDFRDRSFHGRDNGKIVISHIGSLSKSQNPILLFQAIQSYYKKFSENRFRLRFIGSVHPAIKDTINEFKLNSMVEFINYLPHAEAIKHMMESDALLIVVPDLPGSEGIIPGKLYEYLRSGSHIILIGNDNCNAADIVTNFGGFCINQNQTDFKIERITSIRTNQNTSQLNQYSRRSQSERLSEIFSNCVNE